MELIKFMISRGSPLAGSRESEIAPRSQWETQTPQPIQASWSMTEYPLLTDSEKNWQ